VSVFSIFLFAGICQFRRNYKYKFDIFFSEDQLSLMVQSAIFVVTFCRYVSLGLAVGLSTASWSSDCSPRCYSGTTRGSEVKGDKFSRPRPRTNPSPDSPSVLTTESQDRNARAAKSSPTNTARKAKNCKVPSENFKWMLKVLQNTTGDYFFVAHCIYW